MDESDYIPAEGQFGNLLSDQDVARMLRLSPAWVRKQRHLRKEGVGHALTINPVYIGSSPRYRLADFNKWLDGLND